MDLGTVVSAAQTLFKALQNKELQDMLSFLGYRSQLEDLQGTISTIKAALLDAENKEVDSEQARHWIENLKDAVYDADDLFDKFVTIVERKKLKKGGKASEKVRLFLSRYNPFGIANEMSQGVKKIRKKLDAIAKNHDQFGFKIDPQPIRLRREETCSYVRESDIIGREDDVEKIVKHLLNPTNKQVSFLSIVGMGGLGKTALAQLVYNDARVKDAFPLRIWTCVSDHEQDPLDVDQILRKILNKNSDGSTRESLQKQVRAELTRNKYLLVLDDVWTENRHQWLKLEELLVGNEQGCWIVVTTRSHDTARIVGDDPIKHKLQGLSKENSWCLFKKVAFGSEQSIPSDELVKIGQEIVEGCARVPLAIRVAGSLLYGQDKSSWLSFQKIGLSCSQKSKSGIMPILKLSYDQLESPLKNCFTYCALFPKDYVLDVIQLKRLWMAQGYVVPLNDDQSMEEAADEYFKILLRRCFFQDVKYLKRGEINSCKIHDLMHDIAKKIAGKEICIRNFTLNDENKKARHLAYTSGAPAQASFTQTQLRSCLYVGQRWNAGDSKMYLSTSNLEGLLSKWTCLRVFDLRHAGINCLPESIGKLVHLRYLDICDYYDLEMLPKSLIKLYNLETLLLRWCPKLKELPKDFTRLAKLRTLVIIECGIKYLTGLGSLPHLKYLKLFLLDDLEYIDENIGELGGSISAAKPDGRLMIAKGYISFPCLEFLQLCYLSKLERCGNSKLEIGDNSSSMTPMLLPQLKTLTIEYCENLKCNLLLPKLEEVHGYNLNESLQINKLSTSTTFSSSSACSYGVPKLKMVDIQKYCVAGLKGMPVDSFQCLETLWISYDDEIQSLREVKEVFRSCSSSLVSLRIFSCHKLESVISGGLGYLSALENLHIFEGDVLTLSEEKREDGICIGLSCPPFSHSLRHLKLKFLPRLENLPSWIQFCSALETLTVHGCPKINRESLPDWIGNIPSVTINGSRRHYSFQTPNML